jgi:AcrR family transcriptional regulator
VPRPRIHDETLRQRLLEQAGRLLAEEGPQALSLRKLAAEAGTSTTAVYSLFGGKTELVHDVYTEAFRRFGAKLAEVGPTDDPVEDLRRLALAYRAYALANPHLYAVMFGRPIPGAEPEDKVDPERDEDFRPLLDLVIRAEEAGLLIDVPAREVALGLWAIVHGLMSLELNRNVEDTRYELVVGAAMRGWLRDPSLLSPA